MRELYEAAPTSTYEQVKHTIESNLQLPMDEIFSEFDKTPISSASIGQVHIGKLKSNGQKVAVKVQHPWLKEELPVDIKMTELFIDVGAYFFKEFKYRWLVEDMKVNLPQELDFSIEAKNSETMEKLFINNPQIKVPSIYHEYSCDRVLTMEFVDGRNVDNLVNIKD